MKYTYKIINDDLTNQIIIKRSDGAFIPEDSGNSDYQRYLRWLENPDAEEGGTL